MATEQNIHSAAEWEDIPAEKFEIIGTDDFSGDIIARPKIGYWADAWRRLKENKIALVALIVLLLLIVMVCIGPAISGYNFEQMDTSAINQKPSAEHWFGTDSLGRDLFARVWQGGRVSIMIGVVGAVVASVIGCIYGGIASYFGGIVDDIMMRIVEVLLSIPYLIIVILISVVTDSKSIGTMMLALTLTGWCGIARLVRGQMLQLKSQEYVLAANALGVSPFKIIMRHMIPNTIGIIIVAITFDIPGYIFSEAFLSYIGLGIQPPDTSWGALASAAQQNFMFYPYQLFFPSLMIALTMLSFTLLGDGLRDALDPKLQNRNSKIHPAPAQTTVRCHQGRLPDHLRRQGRTGAEQKRTVRIQRRRGQHDFPGPDDLFEPDHDRRQTDYGKPAHPSPSEQKRGEGRSNPYAEDGKHPKRGKTCGQLSA